MIRYSPAILTFISVALATDIEASTQAKTELKVDQSLYPDYFNSPQYIQPDYTRLPPKGEVLPGADFNKHVYEFNGHKQIWDQNDYDKRVKVEAEMLVALEALKESVLYMKADIKEVSSRVNAEKGWIVANMDKTFINFETQ